MATITKITPVRRAPSLGGGHPLMGFGSQSWLGVPKKTVPLSPGNMAGQVAKNTGDFPLASVGGGPVALTKSAVPTGGVPPASAFIPTSAGGSLPIDPAPLDFQGYLNEATTNPMYTGALAAFNTGNATSRAALGAQIGSLITQGGYDLTGKLTGPLESYAGDITPEVMAAANANQLSSRAQIEQNYNRGLQDLAYSLNARGILGSGATATGDTKLLEQSQLAHNSAQQQLLAALTGSVGNYEQGRTAGQQNLDQVLYNVASMLAQQPGNVYSPGDYSTSDVVQQNVGGYDTYGPDGSVQQSPTNIPSAALQPQNNAVQWGPEGKVFTTKAALASYLAQHGANFAQWAINHPAAAKKLR